MNWAVWVPPVISLVVAVGWIGSRQAEVRNVTEDIEVLRESVERERLKGFAEEAGKRGKGKGADQETDWDELAGWLRSMERGAMDARAVMKLQKFLLSLDSAEILAALDEIQGVDLGPKVKIRLEEMLIGRLLEEDAALALQKFGDRLNETESGMHWQLASGFASWLREDPASAQAWYASELEKGSFESRALDGSSDSYIRFESEMLKHLIRHDPAAVRGRLEGIPEGSRSDLFMQPDLVDLMSQEGFSEIIGELLLEEDQGELFSRYASQLRMQGGLERVAEFLENLDAPIAVREEVIIQTARQEWYSGDVQDRERLDRVRNWIAEEAPESLDKATGTVLAMAFNQSQREERVEMLREIHAEGGGDELIVSFLEHGGAGNREELVVELAELISDPEVRDEVVNREPVEERVILRNSIEKP